MVQYHYFEFEPCTRTHTSIELCNSSSGLPIHVHAQTHTHARAHIQVLDSYLTVKINEALYNLKGKLRATEEEVKKVLEEKERLEEAFHEKVQLIRVRKNSLVHHPGDGEEHVCLYLSRRLQELVSALSLLKRLR